MRVLIVEERSSGHLLVYVRLLAEHARARGWEVILAFGSDVAASAEFAREFSGADHATVFYQAPLTPRVLSSLIADTEPDEVVVPHGDELASRFALGRPVPAVPTTLLIMRDPRWERPAPLRRRVLGAMKLLAIGLASRRETIRIVWLRGAGYSGVEPHAVDPFVDDEGAALEPSDAVELPSDAFYFVVTGSITDRKNVPLIIEALGVLQARHPSARVGLALVGPNATSLSADRLASLATAARVRLHVRDALLTNAQMNDVVRRADAVVMAYSSHSPNSTMVKAYVLGTRLVVAGSPAVQGFARGLGFEPVGLRVTELAEACARAMSAARPPARPNPAPVAAFADRLMPSTRA